MGKRILREKCELTPAEKAKLKPEEIPRWETIRYLRERGHWVLPHSTKASYSPKLGRFIKLSLNYGTPGEADLLVFPKDCPTSPVWIELKKKGKRAIDTDQIDFRKRAWIEGHEYYAVNDWKDCVKLGL